MAPPTWHLKVSLFETIYSDWKEVMFGGGRGLGEEGYPPPPGCAPQYKGLPIYKASPLHTKIPSICYLTPQAPLLVSHPFQSDSCRFRPLTYIPHGWTKSAITFLNTLWVKQLCRVCECCSSANSINLSKPRMKLVWGFRGACLFLFFA